MDSRGFHLYIKKLHYYHSGSASALQKHSLLCIIITQERQLAVIFEDDAEVSPHWYGTEIGNLQKRNTCLQMQGTDGWSTCGRRMVEGKIWLQSLYRGKQ